MGKQKTYLDSLGGSCSFSAETDEDDLGPLAGIRATGDAEKDDASEIKVVHSTLSEIDKQVREVMGSGYFLRLVFVTEAQAEVFAKAMNLLASGHPSSQNYDGLALAEQLGIELPIAKIPFRGKRSEKQLSRVGVVPGYPE